MRCAVHTVFRYGIAFLYAGKLVREEGSGYTAGRVMTVIFGAMFGAGFALGQMAPSFPKFASGAEPDSILGMYLRIQFQQSFQLSSCSFWYSVTTRE